MTGASWRRTLWLLRLVLPVPTTIVSPATFACDARRQEIIAYDDVALHLVSDVTPPMCSSPTKGSRIDRGMGLLCQFRQISFRR